MDLSIIIINWKSKNYLRKCLSSLIERTHGVSYEVIVVDNASYDGCDKMLEAEFPAVTFIQSDQNLGFARGNNLGASRARGRNLLFLNPDTEFVENSIQMLGATLDRLPAAGAIGCKLLNGDKTLQTSSIQAFPTIANELLDSDFLRRVFPRSSLWGTAAFLGPQDRPAKVEVISGACTMVKRSAFEAVGGFTKAYFMYTEDVDLCYKMNLAGYEVCYLPTTSVIHFGGSSTRKARSGFVHIMMRESTYKFLRLHRGAASAVFYRIVMGFGSVARLLLMLPLLMAGDRVVRHGTGSFRKWAVVLQWSLGLSTLIAG